MLSVAEHEVPGGASGASVAGLHVAVDVGGTFIDIVLTRPSRDSVHVAKLLHRQGSQGADILSALQSLTKEMGSRIEDIATLVIGTTVVTNALLENKLAKVALITTDGFRDVLEIARMTRASSYDLHKRRPKPLVPRELRLEVKERMSVDGEVLTPLNPKSIEAHIETLRQGAVDAVAVCLLFSYVNPAHELQVRDAIEAALPLPVSLSSDVLPVFREFERANTTVVNAATRPVIERFIDSLSTLTSAGARSYIMGSDAGCLTLPEARRFPARCTLSGPAGGVLASLKLAPDYPDILTLDVGGTSTDVALLRQGVIPQTQERRIGGHAVALPAVEVETVGAGGGSIAHIDRAGLLKVGPHSAGADPGPAAYGLGGVLPTVTDAHITLGRLGTHTMLGGDFPVDRAAAAFAIEEHVGRHLKLDAETAALGILAITTANIARAVRSISVERGHDPRRLALAAFGGAGPLHAAEVARSLGVPTVIVPPHPGVWSAFGLLSADTQYSLQKTWIRDMDGVRLSEVQDELDRMAAELSGRAVADGLPRDALVTQVSLDLRYRGQSFTLPVPLVGGTTNALSEARTTFHAEHEQRHGHSDPDAPVELINIRMTVSYPRSPATTHRPASGPLSEPFETREVWFNNGGPMAVPVYRRRDLSSEAILAEPAIVEQYDSTVVIDPGDRLTVDGRTGALVIAIAQQSGRKL